MKKNISVTSDHFTCKVISKYFSSEPVMDESLSDFQDKKTFYTGPKTTKNAKPVKKKKPNKLIKGQKDIRNLVKSQKNELLSYANEFDKICKKSGLDVDSEQLQLAIALSKSLQEPDSVSLEGTVGTKVLSSQQQTKEIRKTLQEYGFRVRGTQKPSNVPKKRQYKKQYKLLRITDTEREQIISGKYAEVLLRNNFQLNYERPNNNACDGLYYKTTNILYENLKNDDVFYSTNIFQKPLYKSSLLKNWSEIPGRLASPKSDPVNFDFDNTAFTQDELDSLLSGSMKVVQQIVKNKRIFDTTFNDCVVNENITVINNQVRSNNILFPIKLFASESSIEMNHLNDQCSLTSVTGQSQNMLTVPEQSRSMSPDLFDEDEIFVINEDNDVKNMTIHLNKATDNNKTEMDLTECVSNKIHIENPQCETTMQVETIRKSNDFMEITDCVLTRLNQQSVDNIDLTHDSNGCTIYVKQLTQVDCLDMMDLTQSSSSNDELPEVHLSGREKEISCEETIIVNNDYSDINNLTQDEEKQVRQNQTQCNNLMNDISNCKGYRNTDTIIPEENGIYISLLNLSDSKVMESNNKEDSCTLNLTQTFESANKILEKESTNILIDNEVDCLGKINHVSIDYDELYDSMLVNKNVDISTPETTNYVASTEKNYTKNINESLTDTSQVFELSNGENSPIKHYEDNFNFGGISVMNNITEIETTARTSGAYLNNFSNDIALFETQSKEDRNISTISDIICDEKNKDIVNNTPCKLNDTSEKVGQTPISEFLIKTTNVTPLLDYAAMSTPERNRELQKYGIKPFKRKRAIQLLTHIYNQTHPVVESIDELPTSSKVQKRDYNEVPQTSQNPSSRIVSDVRAVDNINLSKDNIYVETKLHPDIKDITCSPEDWVFQKREKSKIHSCRVPLHIAFHNYVSCRQLLREAILCYEPINIDVIHKDLVASGYRYNPKELLKFLDRKCITVKTMDSAKNKRL